MNSTRNMSAVGRHFGALAVGLLAMAALLFTASGSDASEAVQLGDVNCDQIVDRGDSQAIAEYLVGSLEGVSGCPIDASSQINLAVGDINGDNSVATDDAWMIDRCTRGSTNSLCPQDAPLGDVNCDGVVDSADVAAMTNYQVGLVKVSPGCPLDAAAEINLAAGDVNFDGAIGIADALLIEQCVNGVANSSCTVSPDCDTLDFTVDLAAGETPTAGPDIIRGTPGDDIIDAKGGDDVVCGFGGDDTILAGYGNDRVVGGEGHDTIRGGGGNDLLLGGSGNDDIHGISGDDVMHGGDGADKLYGNGGNDFLRGGNGDDHLHGMSGHDRLDGGAGDDNIYGSFGDDYLHGRTGDDRLFGEADDDFMVGGAGDDFLHGGYGDDKLGGEAGYDELFGQQGRDSLSGGPNPVGKQDLLDSGNDLRAWDKVRMITGDDGIARPELDTDGFPIPVRAPEDETDRWEIVQPDCWFW